MRNAILTLMFRKAFRSPSYSIIILSGLVVGITTAILVFSWITYELDFDRYHPDNEKVFGVMMNESIDGTIETYEESPVALGDYLLTGIPEIESVTQIDNTQGMLSYGAKTLQKRGMYADSGYFSVFYTEMISGDKAHPLPDKNSIVISERLAQLLFDGDDALGKIVTLNLKSDFKVTGVFSELPENSSLSQYEFVLPFHAKQRDPEDWQNYYVKLNNVGARKAVEQKIDAKLQEIMGNQSMKSLLFCLTDWRLHWSFENGKVSGGRIVYIIIFGIAAFFILFMAIINYVNIMTANATKRAREIGVRKMTGATRNVLIRQFLLESMMVTCIAAIISVGFAYMLLPAFNQLTNVKLFISFADPLFLAGLFGITLLTGLVGGSYPAFLLSSLKPAIVLKGNSQAALTGAGLRKALSIFQFTLSIILIFSAVVMYQQTDYLLKKDLGYDKNNVLNLWVGPNLPLQSFKAEILTHSSVLAAGICGASPMEINGSAEVRWPGKADTNPMMLNGVSADYDLIPTLKLEIVEGRNFSPEFPADSSAFIITQQAANMLGFVDPIGQTITYTMFGEREGKIIGIVKDFHNEDIHVKADPVIFTFGRKDELYNLFVRYNDGHLDEVLTHVKMAFNKIQPGIPLSYSFLDQDFENQFYQEKLLGSLSVWFTVIALMISGLGLLGLTIFYTQRREKEIGVRKVLGASVLQVLILICNDFFRPVIISFLLAFPMAYYLMEQFLEGYTFRISIPVFTFILVAIATIAFVLLTVSYKSIRAALKDPVDSLKTE